MIPAAIDQDASCAAKTAHPVFTAHRFFHRAMPENLWLPDDPLSRVTTKNETETPAAGMSQVVHPLLPRERRSERPA
jgi:hypothetical protein